MKMFAVWRLLFLLVCLCIQLTKEQEDKINIKETDATKQEGSCITIHCTYDAQEGMQLLWFKDPVWDANKKMYNGTIVYSNTKNRPQASDYSNRVKFQNTSQTNNQKQASCTLQINNLLMSDAGNYSFRYIAKDDSKYISKDYMNLKVEANPCNVHIKPLNTTVKEGENVHLQCSTSVKCQHHPEWQPQHNQGYISETKSDEKISELQLTVSWMDNGKMFSCHPAGSMDDCQARQTTLTVEYAPKNTNITASSEKVKEGQNVTLSCSSMAHPNASFRFFKGMLEYSALQSTNEYKLDQIKPENEGSYHCQASNSHGEHVSLPVIITVTYAPKGVYIKGEPSDVKEGDQLKLTCEVQKSFPTVNPNSFSWYSSHQLKENSKELYISNITRHQSGKYYCQASNEVGSTKSNPVEIFVKWAPGGTSITGSNEIKLSLDLNLDCTTSANPPPDQYFWYFKKEGAQHYVVHSNTTQSKNQIKKAAIEDSGWYMCTSRNVIGRGPNSTEFELHVLYPPRQPTLDMPVTVKESEMLIITCTVKSFPVASIKLTRNSEEVMKGESQSNVLIFSGNASRSHAGLYTCTAENSEGNNVRKQQLKVLYAPKDVQASVSSRNYSEGNDLKLTCNASSEPSVSLFTWKKTSGMHTEDIKTGQNLTLHSLKRSNSGNYSCTASNTIGRNTSASVQIRVHYRPDVKIIHNLTSLDHWYGEAPVQLTCHADCFPSASRYEWHKKDGDSKQPVSTIQNYTVQSKNQGIYYCVAENDIGASTSEPVDLFVYGFDTRLLLLLILIIICIMIVLIFLVYRFFLGKRSSDGADSQLFFFTLSSRSTGPQNNTRENLVVVEPYRPKDNLPASTATTTAALNRSNSRDNIEGREGSNMHTVYDSVKLSRIKQEGFPHTEKTSAISSVSYANVPVKGHKDPTKSERSTEVVYAMVSKNKQNTKEVPQGNEDYENLSGACAPKPDFSNIIWESDTSEEEEEVNYTQVTVTAAPQHKQQWTGDDSTSDEEDRTEYSQVKV